MTTSLVTLLFTNPNQQPKKKDNRILHEGSNNQIGHGWQRKIFSVKICKKKKVHIVSKYTLYQINFINVLNLKIETRRSVGY